MTPPTLRFPKRSAFPKTSPPAGLTLLRGAFTHAQLPLFPKPPIATVDAVGTGVLQGRQLGGLKCDKRRCSFAVTLERGVNHRPPPPAPITGNGVFGQLGNGNTRSVTAIPVSVSTPENVTVGWSAISAGRHHTCAIAESTRIAYCWGACGAIVLTKVD